MKGRRANPTGLSVSIPIDQEAPSGSHSPSSSDHQSSSVHQGVAAEHLFEVNPFVLDDPEPFVNVFAPDHNSEALFSRVIVRTESNQTTQPHEHLRKWTASHPIDNIIGNPSRPVSTQKHLATDALWCFYNSVLSKVKQKNFKSTVTEDCWFQAMQDKIHEFDRLDVWELVPPPDCATIIALKWIYKVKLDERGGVLKNKANQGAKGKWSGCALLRRYRISACRYLLQTLGQEKLEFRMKKVGMQSMSSETMKKLADETEELW
ncbi:retrovirus-related pol polyprotein from transposon TNT 1-94, partial [Tanacetum coccineum]